MSAAVPYRPEIDGLRAVAVLAVVLFHAGIGPFTGGYTGVDVFFVISGFLITSIIVREIDAGAFSFADFYERRIRRIFPALFVVIAAAFVAGWFILTPRDYQDFARSAINTAVFTSNFAFNERAGYFAPAAETQPLLHTWSLAVEEQFYLIAPFALILLYRLRVRPRVLVFAGIFFASLIAAEYGVRKEWSSSFYLVHARAWELMTGMAVALGFLPRLASRTGAEALGIAGIALIAAAIGGYTPQTPFPGFAALLPCFGAALVIYSTAGATTLTQRVLSSAPAVAIGKISYSLYLWHWPLLAFAAYGWQDETGLRERLALIALAFVLSILTYLYVEQPARKRRESSARRSVFIAGGAAIAACLAIGGLLLLTRGAPERLPPGARAFADSTPHKLREKGFCTKPPDTEDDAGTYCLIGDASKKTPSFVLWGDSHALAVGPTLAKLAADKGQLGYLIATGGCPPLLGLEELASSRFAKCITSADALQKLLERSTIRNIIIVARWGLYAEGSGGMRETNVNVRILDATDVEHNRAALGRLLQRTVAKLAEGGVTVTVFGPVPELPYNLTSEVIKDIMRGRVRDYAQRRDVFEIRQRAVFPILKQIDGLPGVRVLYPHDVICSAEVCETLEGGRALYADDDHLSAAGAEKLSALLATALTELPASDR